MTLIYLLTVSAPVAGHQILDTTCLTLLGSVKDISLTISVVVCSASSVQSSPPPLGISTASHAVGLPSCTALTLIIWPGVAAVRPRDIAVSASARLVCTSYARSVLGMPDAGLVYAAPAFFGADVRPRLLLLCFRQGLRGVCHGIFAAAAFSRFIYRRHKAAFVLGGQVGKIAHVCPQLLLHRGWDYGEGFALRAACRGYADMRNVCGDTRYHFAVPCGVAHKPYAPVARCKVKLLLSGYLPACHGYLVYRAALPKHCFNLAPCPVLRLAYHLCGKVLHGFSGKGGDIRR